MRRPIVHRGANVTLPRVVVGITAHNEGRNLGRLLERLRSTDLRNGELLRIVVVVSGCTDDTVAIAKRAAEHDGRIRVVVDPERRGKAVAIGQLLEEARDADVIVMESADTLPENGAIDAMLARFADPSVGMVGAHPVPEDDESTFMGFTTRLLWDLHHSIASSSPKQGELVAWRNVIDRFPPDIAMDEAYLEAAVTAAGYRLAYAPEAIVRNRGASTVRAFIAQRRRNHTGHRVLAARYGYRPATRDHLRLATLGARYLLDRPSRAPWMLAAALLEIWCSVLGWWDYAVAHRWGTVWTMIEGTKALLPDPPVTTPSVVAIVVTHRGRENVLECLASLERNAYPSLHAIVVDNGTDGAGDAVRSRYPDVEVIQTRNDGLAAAFNVGLAAAYAHDPAYVLQLNDDVVLAADHVARIVEAAERRPRAAAVGGPVYRYDDPERIWFAGGAIVWPLGKTYHRGREMLDGPRFERARPVAYACGAAVLYRTAALREVGGWDEGYFLVFEDADWSVRAARAGWELWYEPAPKAWHRISQSFGGEKSALYLYFLFRNNVRFMRLHGRPWHWPTFVLFFLLESVIRYSLESLLLPDRSRRLRAIWLAVRDALRGTTGRGPLDDLRQPGRATEAVVTV
jgi:GT2 family glycosyltransferase